MNAAADCVPCKECGDPTPMRGTMLCNPCWEIRHALGFSAKLAKAAPDLLAACERAEDEIIELLELDENSTSVPSVLLDLRAAIAKARGR